MILEKTSIPLVEVNAIVKDMEDKQTLQIYLNKFTKLTKDKAKHLSEEIIALNNMKIREEQVIKIVDFLPCDAEELNKIFIDTPLSEDEIKSILEITARY
jgi:DNA-directed RNA polymerase subunit F